MALTIESRWRRGGLGLHWRMECSLSNSSRSSERLSLSTHVWVSRRLRSLRFSHLLLCCCWWDTDKYARAVLVGEACVTNIGHFIIIILDKFMIRASTWTLTACGDLKSSREFLKWQRCLEMPDKMHKCTWCLLFLKARHLDDLLWLHESFSGISFDSIEGHFMESVYTFHIHIHLGES